jgi:hypothetical protein
MYCKCKYLKQRQKNYKWYGYCTKRRKIVPLFCKECDVVEYKEQKTFKSRTNKQAKREKERFSIIYRDLTKCCNCGLKTGDFDKRINQYTRIEKNEVFEGSYRQVSIRLGMIAPLCIFCHKQFHKDILGMNLSYKIKFEKEYLKTHTREEFIKTFGQDYIFKLEQKKRS